MNPLTRNSEGVHPIDDEGNITGMLLVLPADHLKPRYRFDGRFQLWTATGGFGCHPQALGKAVYARCIADGEEARWNRSDFIGAASHALHEQAIAEGSIGAPAPLAADARAMHMLLLRLTFAAADLRSTPKYARLRAVVDDAINYLDEHANP